MKNEGIFEMRISESNSKGEWDTKVHIKIPYYLLDDKKWRRNLNKLIEANRPKKDLYNLPCANKGVKESANQ